MEVAIRELSPSIRRRRGSARPMVLGLHVLPLDLLPGLWKRPLGTPRGWQTSKATEGWGCTRVPDTTGAHF